MFNKLKKSFLKNTFRKNYSDITKLISIIIPVYNGKKYINNAIISCLNQTYKNIEIIIINDGSTDGLNEQSIVKKSSKISFVSKKNEGLGKTRNLGINRAKGDYLFFLDVDDTLPENALQKLINGIGNNDFVIGKCKRIFLNKNNEPDKEKIWKNKIFFQQKNKYNLIVDTISTNKLYRRSFLQKNNIYFKEGIYEDKLFILKIFEATKKFTVIHDVVYNWMVTHDSDSITNTFTIENLRARMKINYECIEFTSDEKLKSTIINNVISHDLKIYINNSKNYSSKQLNDLYEIYLSFVKKYKSYIDYRGLLENWKIIKNIEHKERVLALFLKIANKKFDVKVGSE